MSDGHFIVEDTKGRYLYPRRPISNSYPGRYQSRSSWGDEYNSAKVFTTRNAATQSARASGNHYKWRVIKVYLSEIEHYGWQK